MKYIVMNVVYKPNSSDYEFGIAEIISKFANLECHQILSRLLIVRGDNEMIHRVKMDVQKIYVGRSIEHERGFKIGDEGQMLIYRGNIVI